MRRTITLLALIILSLVSVALVTGRAHLAGNDFFAFLRWNLFLAWLPLLFAALAVAWRTRPLLLLACGFLWLLFFPNAPYLVTDLIHLRHSTPVTLWYDLLMLLSFAFTGLLLGLISLRLMHGLVQRRFGPAAGWLFVLAALSASGFGLYIGRVLRWNSWDLFSRPLALLAGVAPHLMRPQTIVLCSLLAMMLLGAYLLLHAAGDIARTRTTTKSR